MAGPEVEAFKSLIPIKMAEEPWNYNYTLLSGKKVSDIFVIIVNENL